MYKVERWEFEKGERVLFYVREDQEPPPNLITVRCYTSHEGVQNYNLRLLEKGIYTFSIIFRFLGKYILVFSEDEERKLIVIVTIK